MLTFPDDVCSEPANVDDDTLATSAHCGGWRADPLGTHGSFSMVVGAEHLANRFMDATLPEVLATPVMVMAMENAALNAIKPYFEAGESAVGTRVAGCA